MNGNELAGFVHGSEVEEPLHLSAVVHPQILYPPDNAPPARVKRTVVGGTRMDELCGFVHTQMQFSSLATYQSLLKLVASMLSLQ